MFITFRDIIFLIIVVLVHNLLTNLHKTLLSGKYSSILILTIDEKKKIFPNTCIRTLTIIVETIIFSNLFNFDSNLIVAGIGIASFLIVWPAIVQYKLIGLQIGKEKFKLLICYFSHIFLSILISYITVHLFIPNLAGKEFFLLDNSTLSIVKLLLTGALSFQIDRTTSHTLYNIDNNRIEYFEAELYLIKKAINMQTPRIEGNIHEINKCAEKYNIDPELLKCILSLENYYRILEWLGCKIFKKTSIKHDLSIGLGQIKISTAKKLLKQNPKFFIHKLIYDDFNIELSAKYIRYLIDTYNSESISVYSNRNKKYQFENDRLLYVVCHYLGSDFYEVDKTTLIYYTLVINIITNDELIYNDTN